MTRQVLQAKRAEWLRRYIPAELLGTTIALIAAWIVFTHSHSYIAAAAAGWIGEGIGFFGYFITLELLRHHQKLSAHSFWKRLLLTITGAGTNLLIEFLPAEIIDNFIIRPFAIYLAPIYIHPYPLGFLIGKLSADIIFYAIAIIGYETRKRWVQR